MRQRAYDLTGWTLFGIGCLVFLIHSIRNGEALTVAGSALFLAGVIVVLVPYAQTN